MEQKKGINKKLIAIIACIAAVVCIAIAVVVNVTGGNSGKKLTEQLELAEHYMDELKYEKAIAAYEKAIEIDPKCKEAYLGLAEVYIAMGDYEEAVKVLEEGYEATDSKTIRKKLEELKESEGKEDNNQGSAESGEGEPNVEASGEDEQQADTDTPEQGKPVFVPWEEAGLEDYVMDWQDENLEAAMREVTGIRAGNIMLSDVWEITCLDIRDREISDISALSGLTNLANLELGSNNISDISALSGLTNLTYLGLWDNNISDISALNGLTNLTNLNLEDNNISDISALSGLMNLQYLHLSGNNISDYSPVSFVPNLYY